MAVPPFPSVPAPATYADGPLLVSELRADVTNGVNFLANKPVFSATCTSRPAIPSGAQTPVVLDTESYDNWGGHDPLGAHPERYYCQAPGYYIGEAYVPWTYTGATNLAFQASIGVQTLAGFTTYSGQQAWTNSGASPGVAAADLFHLTRTGLPGSTGTDYVQLQAFTTGSGITLTGSGNNFPRLSLRWAGTGATSSLGVPANAAFPVPPSFVSTTWLNANIRDTLKYLAGPPLLRYSYTPGSNTLVSGVWATGTKIALNTKTVDNFSGWSVSNNQWTAPRAGVHWMAAAVGLVPSTSAASYACGITVNGTTTWGSAILVPSGASASASVITSLNARFRLAQGDVVSLAGFQNSGGNLALKPTTKLAIAWESN